MKEQQSTEHSSSKSQRYYASIGQYLLPADEVETQRLNKQHDIIVRAFEHRLVIAPVNLQSGDPVLESAAGSGIWALKFFENIRADGVIVDMECIDISSKQFPATHPPQMHFSENSITKLPNPEWNNRFSYIHQRLLIGAMNDTLWRSAVAEIFRVLKPGGWVELLEIDFKLLRWGVGPHSKRLAGLIRDMCAGRGVIVDLNVYLPALLKGAGFLEVQCLPRRVQIGGEKVDQSVSRSDSVEGDLDRAGLENGGSDEAVLKNGYSTEEWRDLCLGFKGPIMQGGGYDVVKTGEEYDSLLESSSLEWKNSKEAETSFYAILARKPF
ncbi:hypothetical protein J3R30DRAFT_2951639 [Lentinula aciculospora]|uniref:S-adenosyl-L-methionine-dependent methyltransferase n=1 Tax=Lentinula aciculospora TaxID=153920 RepID=A0A9W8ZSN5_9AGAR|nr:hypothetical protein J3R30DRAFT_2951639 [Lentinula aciculospora]